MKNLNEVFKTVSKISAIFDFGFSIIALISYIDANVTIYIWTRKEFNFDRYFRLSIIVSETKAFDYFISAELSEMTKHGKKPEF